MTLMLFNPDAAVTILHSQAFKEFGCDVPKQQAGRRDRHKLTQKRERIAETVDDFLDVMATDNPPQSEAEVIAALVPLSTWLLSWIIRRLVVQVIRFCWRKYQEAKQPAEGSAV